MTSGPWQIALRLLAAIASCLVIACSVARKDERGTGVHPSGWGDLGNAKGADFHARYLRDNKYPLAECRTCHGEDYQGGPVGVSCASASCHSGNAGARPALGACNTCHGTTIADDKRADHERARPADAAHQKHRRFCSECHAVPKRLEDPGHGDGTTLVRFEGTATAGGLTPTWNKSQGTCADVYCHGGKGKSSPAWTKASTTPATCSTCHEAPPKTHERFKRLTADGTKCSSCHPEADPDPKTDFFAEPMHVDGIVQMTPKSGCATCHGSTADGAPPVALDGSTDPSKRGVGAHQRHLDPKLADRIGRVVACDRCHAVPTSVVQPGHLDGASTVKLGFGESFDVKTGSCVNGCHFDRTPGPVWTDVSGAARKCDGCHAFPPDRTRTGTIHPAVAADVATCRLCHRYEPATHVDGRVDFLP